LEFCTKLYYVKVSLVKSIVKSGSRGVPENLFRNFWTFLQISTNFGILKQFLQFKTIEKHLNPWAQYWAETGPRLQPTGHGGLPRAVGRNSGEAAAWRLGLAQKTPRVARDNARTPRARGVVTARGPRVRWRGGGFTGGPVGAGRRQGVASEHRWGPGVAPGKKISGGAHPIGGASGEAVG
jgi:hypothetical protein